MRKWWNIARIQNRKFKKKKKTVKAHLGVSANPQQYCHREAESLEGCS